MNSIKGIKLELVEKQSVKEESGREGEPSCPEHTKEQNQQHNKNDKTKLLKEEKLFKEEKDR